MHPIRLLRNVLVELCFWFSAASTFLWVYITQFAGDEGAARAHLQVLSTFWLGLATLRICTWILVSHRTAARRITNLLTAVFAAVALAYYAVTLVGLQSWGRVVTWTLISTYAAESPALLMSIGVPVFVAVLCLLAYLIMLYLLMDRLILRHDWLSTVRTLRPLVACTLLLGCSGLFFSRGAAFISEEYAGHEEPVSLTLLSELSERQTRRQMLVGDPLLERIEDQARQTYRLASKFPARNLILIVVDALRADHLGLLGYERDTTPFLSSLHRAGKLQAYPFVVSVCAESHCGLAGLSQSRYLHQFTPNAFSLYEVLKCHGYTVNMILGGDHTNFYSLRGQYKAVDLYFDGSSAAGFSMNDDRLVTHRLESQAEWDGAPTMIQFHLMSSHYVGVRHPEWMHFQPAASYARYAAAPRVVRPSAPTPETTNYYDNGVLQTDAVIRKILETLERKGYLHDTLVAITGDHGELLGEHGEFGHSKTVYQPVLRVPLLLVRYGYAPPQSPPAPAPAIVSQTDVAPTLLAELGLPLPASWSGTPLQNGPPQTQVLFQEHSLVGLYDLTEPSRPLKYWRDVRSGEEYLFDPLADPEESQNIIAIAPPEQREQWRLAVAPASVRTR